MINRFVIKITLLLILIVLFLMAYRFILENPETIQSLGNYGYVGAFLLAIVGGFNLAVPIPPVLFLPVLVAAGLNFWLLLLTISLGVTLADSLAYLLGSVGREVARGAFSKKMEKRMEKLGQDFMWAPPVALFFFAAFVPFPNEVLVIPLSFLGYRFLSLLPALFFGNFLFNLLASFGFLGFFGLFT